MKNFWILGLGLLAWGCKPTAVLPTVEKNSFSAYYEDRKSTLPTFPEYKQVMQQATPASNLPSQAVDKELEKLAFKRYQRAKMEPYFTGYTVLVYSGVDRNEAFKARDHVTLFFPEISPEMQYQQPRYLVKVGQFAYKIEAQRIFSLLKTQFPTARILQDRFQRKEYSPPSTDSNAERTN